MLAFAILANHTQQRYFVDHIVDMGVCNLSGDAISIADYLHTDIRKPRDFSRGLFVTLIVLEELEVGGVDTDTSQVVSCVTQAACRVGKL